MSNFDFREIHSYLWELINQHSEFIIIGILSLSVMTYVKRWRQRPKRLERIMSYMAPSMEIPGNLCAGFWVRVGAALIDGVIVLVPTVLILSLLPVDGFVSFQTTEADGSVITDHSFSAMGSFLCGLAFLVYKAALESSQRKATLGKRALKLVVTDFAGNRISFGTAVFRGWPMWLPLMLITSPISETVVVWASDTVGGLAVISCLVVGRTKRKLGLHDLMAKCMVVKLESKFKSVDV